MNSIKNFLNNTTLSAEQTILITLIFSFIMVISVSLFKNFYNFLAKEVSKLVKSVKDKNNRYKRLKSNKITSRERRDLLSKRSSGKQLSKAETEFLNRSNKEWEVSIKKISQQIQNMRFPKLPQ